MTNDSSLICDKILKTTKCVSCRKTLESPSNINDHDSTDEHDTPKRPSDIFNINFKRIVFGLNDVLPEICAEKCLKRKLLEELHKIEIHKMGCPKHHLEVAAKLKHETAFYGIVTFIKSINDLLCGKNQTLRPGFNYVEELAHIFYQKKKRIGKHSDIFK